MEKRKISIYTDGLCIPNPGLGTWAFHCHELKYHEVGISYFTTNNKMELTAISEALKWIAGKDPDNKDLKTDFKIYSDSKYCVNGFNSWMHKWQKHNWTKSGDLGNPERIKVKNDDLWLKIYDHKDVVSRLYWIKGHAGNKGNEKANQLCEEYYEKMTGKQIKAKSLDQQFKKVLKIN